MVKMGWTDADVMCFLHADGVLEFVLEPHEPRTDYMVTSVRLHKANSSHTRLRFWNRGASTGEWLVVHTMDAHLIVARLFAVDPILIARAFENRIPEGG